jgi:predicted alpha/beta superfamily hydrolase
VRLLWSLVFAAVPAWAQSAPGTPAPRDPTPKHVTFTLESRALGEPRVINVYTPPGYDSLAGTSFPVVYMPDGGLAEDFPHIANTLDSLIALGAIAPVILVGIENTERRRDLTGPTAVATDSAIARRVGGSAGFRRFLREELMPSIRQRYRSTDETAIVGESLAGLFIVETFLLEPDLFRRYIALSPSLWWNGGFLLRVASQRLKDLGDFPRTVYLTAATEPGIAAETRALAGILKEHAPAGVRWFYEPRADLEHSTIFRMAVPAAFVKALR